MANIIVSTGTATMNIDVVIRAIVKSEYKIPKTNINSKSLLKTGRG